MSDHPVREPTNIEPAMTLSSPHPTAPYAALIAEIRALYGPGPIPLHRPVFEGPERRCPSGKPA